MTQTNTTTAESIRPKLKLDIAVHGRTERWQVANALPGGAFGQQTWPRPASRGSGSRRPAVTNAVWWSTCARRLHRAGAAADPGQGVRPGASTPCQERCTRCRADCCMHRCHRSTRGLRQIRDWPNWLRYLTFLEQLEEDIARFKTRLEHIEEPALRRLVNSDIVRLKARKAAQICSLAKRLRAHQRSGKAVRSGAEHSRHRRAHGAGAHHPYARARPHQPRGSRSPGWSCTLR